MHQIYHQTEDSTSPPASVPAGIRWDGDQFVAIPCLKPISSTLLHNLLSVSRWEGFHIARLEDDQHFAFRSAQLHPNGFITLLGAVDMDDHEAMCNSKYPRTNLDVPICDLKMVCP